LLHWVIAAILRIVMKHGVAIRSGTRLLLTGSILTACDAKEACSWEVYRAQHPDIEFADCGEYEVPLSYPGLQPRKALGEEESEACMQDAREVCRPALGRQWGTASVEGGSMLAVIAIVPTTGGCEQLVFADTFGNSYVPSDHETERCAVDEQGKVSHCVRQETCEFAAQRDVPEASLHLPDWEIPVNPTPGVCATDAGPCDPREFDAR
jgi:hypothetical protein